MGRRQIAIQLNRLKLIPVSSFLFVLILFLVSLFLLRSGCSTNQITLDDTQRLVGRITDVRTLRDSRRRLRPDVTFTVEDRTCYVRFDGVRTYEDFLNADFSVEDAQAYVTDRADSDILDVVQLHHNGTAYYTIEEENERRQFDRNMSLFFGWTLLAASPLSLLSILFHYDVLRSRYRKKGDTRTFVFKK